MSPDNTKSTNQFLIDYTGELDHKDVDSIAQRHLMDIFDQDSTLEIERKSLRVVLKKHFKVPRYQRLYSWKRKHHQDLWSEIEDVANLEVFSPPKGFSTSNKLTDVFFGSVFLADVEDEKLEVIDGQQRITTVFLILSLIREKLEGVDIDNGDLAQLKQKAESQIERLTIRIPDDQFSKEPSIVYSNDANNRLFLALIGNDQDRKDCLREAEEFDGRKSDAEKSKEIAKRLGITNPEESPTHLYHPVSNERLIGAYEFYENKLNSQIDDLGSDKSKVRLLINLKNYLLRSLIVGRVKVKSGASPELRMNIFRSLNDRGMELTTIDIIRSRIVTRFHEKDDDEEIEMWERIVDKFGTDDEEITLFLRNYLAAYESDVSKLEEVDEQHILQVFSLKDRERYDFNSRLKTDEDASDLLEEISRHSDLYLDLVEYEESDFRILDQDEREETRNILRRLHNLNTRQWRPLALKAYELAETEDSEQFLELLENIEKIFLRLSISEFRANTLESTFVKAAHDIEEDLDDASEILLDKAKDDLGGIFGKDFVDVLIESSDIHGRSGRAIMEKMSQSILRVKNQGNPHQEDLEMENAELEHILPDEFIRDSDTPMIWVENFFADSEFRSLDTIEEDSDLHQHIEEKFVNELSNMILLKDVDNSACGNKPFSKKIYYYYRDDYFQKIPINSFLSEKNPDFPEDKIHAKEENEHFWNSYWDVNNLMERRRKLFSRLLLCLSFEEAEFTDFVKGDLEDFTVKEDLDEMINEEMEDRNNRLEFELEEYTSN